MRSHPPIFNRLTMRLDWFHEANYVARRIVYREDREHARAYRKRISEETRRLLDYQRHPRFNNYRQGMNE